MRSCQKDNTQIYDIFLFVNAWMPVAQVLFLVLIFKASCLPPEITTNPNIPHIRNFQWNVLKIHGF